MTVRLLALLAVFTLAVVANWTAARAAEPGAAGKPDADGFITMFDGKSLDGWEVMNGGKFVAEDGVIKLHGGRGWLRFDRELADFHVQLEFRFMKEKQDGGVFLRASRDGGNWPNKRYEVQINNNATMAKIFGAKYESDTEQIARLLKVTSEWNRYDIVCAGSKIEVRLNGELVTTSESLEPRAGFIGLQGEGGEHEYRNLRVKPLPAKQE